MKKLSDAGCFGSLFCTQVAPWKDSPEGTAAVPGRRRAAGTEG